MRYFMTDQTIDTCLYTHLNANSMATIDSRYAFFFISKLAARGEICIVNCFRYSAWVWKGTETQRQNDKKNLFWCSKSVIWCLVLRIVWSRHIAVKRGITPKWRHGDKTIFFKYRTVSNCATHSHSKQMFLCSVFDSPPSNKRNAFIQTLSIRRV